MLTEALLQTRAGTALLCCGSDRGSFPWLDKLSLQAPRLSLCFSEPRQQPHPGGAVIGNCGAAFQDGPGCSRFGSGKLGHRPALVRDACFGPGVMGCTTSVVVFDGLRTVLQRNCGYICKSGAAEPVGQNEAEQAACSRRESRVPWPTPRVLKVCVCRYYL